MAHMIEINGNEVPVFVRVTGGFVDAQVRAANLAAFEAAAKVAGLLYEVTETVTNPETGETIEQGTGVWELAAGVEIDHIGPIEISPGTEIVPPGIDTRHHANIRLSAPATTNTDEFGNLLWHKWAVEWTQNGALDEQVNANEEARVLMDVALIDPDTISSPSRVFL